VCRCALTPQPLGVESEGGSAARKRVADTSGDGSSVPTAQRQRHDDLEAAQAAQAATERRLAGYTAKAARTAAPQTDALRREAAAAAAAQEAGEASLRENKAHVLAVERLLRASKDAEDAGPLGAEERRRKEAHVDDALDAVLTACTGRKAATRHEEVMLTVAVQEAEVTFAAAKARLADLLAAGLRPSV
jgi:hypothetical protein